MNSLVDTIARGDHIPLKDFCICMLYSGDHRKHVVIRRQISTLLEAGYSLAIIDQSCHDQAQHHLTYRRISYCPFELRLLSKWIWKFLRPIFPRNMSEAYWTMVGIVRMFVDALWHGMLALKFQSDVLHAHDLGTMIGAVFVGKLKGRSVIYDAHEIASQQGDPKSIQNRILRCLEKYLIPNAEYILVPNQSRSEFYQERYSLKNKPTVILNCPPRSNMAPAKKLMEELDMSDSKRLVLYHGSLIPGRALEELMRSAHYFDEGIQMVVIGEQNAYSRSVLEKLCIGEGLRDRIRFLPYIEPDSIMAYVTCADLGVVIYKNINLNNYLCAPLKVYEYFMANVPVVVCDFPEMRDLLKEYPVGLTFNPEEPLSIARAINKFFRTEKMRKKEITHFISLARDRFSWENESIQLLGVYRTLGETMSQNNHPEGIKQFS